MLKQDGATRQTELIAITLQQRVWSESELFVGIGLYFFHLPHMA